MQSLPKNIIGDGNNPDNPEPRKISVKYSQADAKIGEEEIDYAALGYMSPEAALYWLPRFFDYLRNGAEADSFHYEVIGQKMVNQSWVNSLKSVASRDDIDRVSEDLEWFGKQPYVDPDNELSSAAQRYAVALWKA